MPDNFSAYICQNPLTSWREVLGYTLVVNHPRAELFTLSEVAGLVWRTTSTWVHTDQVVKTVQNEYDVDDKTARGDTLTFVKQLLNCGLLIAAPCTANTDYGEIVKPNELLTDLSEQIPVELRNLCRINRVPLIAYLELTLKCNLHCAHCYNAHRPQPELKTDEIKIVLDDLGKLGCLDLVFTGGEPCVRKDFEEILWYAREKRFCVTLKTNGSMIDGKLASLLAKALVVEVHVSLYSLIQNEHEGITRVPGSLSQTLHGIECLLQEGVRVRLSCPITKLNCSSVRGIKEFAERIGASYGFDPIITARVDGSRDPTDLRIDIADWQKLLKNGLLSEVIYPNSFNVNDSSSMQLGKTKSLANDDHVCGAGSGSIAITAYGDVLPCLNLQIHVGNVLKDRLPNIWRDEPAWHPIRTITPNHYTECKDCNLVNYCPRCPGVALSETGRITAAAPILCQTALFYARSRGLKEM